MSQSMKITFRDKEHFYKVVHWLNENVGKGKGNWTIHGKVLKHFRGKMFRPDTSSSPVTRTVIVHKENFSSDEIRLYLSLI